ncbi:hypothetical protein GCM10011588_28250 [Nocardia jinanensis]|uniref:Uncharacterized protein n=1 Tax=Nocardia jinanensis TaxID=382504 RepID=A0A917RK07_9NOCA|nr:hypothetical protein GCM10011588_28250 [Nocardia jinanensis]
MKASTPVATPRSGIGTGLALIGRIFAAGELAAGGSDHRLAYIANNAKCTGSSTGPGIRP